MEDLFDKIKDEASKAKDAAGRFAKDVAKRTSNVITSTKLSYSINEANNKIKDIYAEIGKDMYEEYLDGDVADSKYTEAFEKIDALMQDIEKLQDRKAELKNALRCAECGTLNPLTAEFCSNCGAKLEGFEVSNCACEDDADEEVEEITITPEQG